MLELDLQLIWRCSLTDIATGWTVNRSVKNKAAIWVFEAMGYVIARFPFPILGIDSDNGSEFINAHLLAYCRVHKITFTRSRPGNKNDGAHVEQKNWTHVRQLVGYLRFDTPDELAVLNGIWELDMGYTNLLLAQQKLVSKQQRRQGHQTVRPSSHPLSANPRPPGHHGALSISAANGHGRCPSREPLPPDPGAHQPARTPGADQDPRTCQAPCQHRLQPPLPAGGST